MNANTKINVSCFLSKYPIGIKANIKKDVCKIYGNGLEGYKYKKNQYLGPQIFGSTLIYITINNINLKFKLI